MNSKARTVLANSDRSRQMLGHVVKMKRVIGPDRRALGAEKGV